MIDSKIICSAVNSIRNVLSTHEHYWKSLRFNGMSSLSTCIFISVLSTTTEHVIYLEQYSDASEQYISHLTNINRAY